MYTAYIGKRLIQAINERDGSDYTPRGFFETVFVSLMFPSERYAIHINNSPYAQAYNFKAKKPITNESLGVCLQQVHEKIGENKRDASIYLGAASSELMDSTSGQVTSMSRDVPTEDVYASWIGTALGITIEGGLSLLIDDTDVLLALYEGWKRYRQVLNETPPLKANQVNTWNGHWVTYRLGRSYAPQKQWLPTFNKDGSAIETVAWVQLVLSLALFFRSDLVKTINAYIYSFGQMNRTAGFVRFNLPVVRRLADLYDTLFTVPEGLPSKNFELLYQTDLSFIRAFQYGEIGTRALQPKDMRSVLDGKKEPKYIESDAQKQFLFQTHQLWIIAMLNNKDLIKKAEILAAILQEHSGSSQRGKMLSTRQTDEVLQSKTRRDFIAQLTTIIGWVGEDNAGALNDLVEEIMALPADNVPLFLTLVRFKYAYFSAKPAALAALNGTTA